jgi:hypothetical protein
MRLSLFRLLTPALILAAQVSMATACINDRESLRSEKEFKSSYIENQPRVAPSYQPEPSGDNQLLTFGGIGAGIALLVSGCVLGLGRTRSA